MFLTFFTLEVVRRHNTGKLHSRMKFLFTLPTYPRLFWVLRVFPPFLGLGMRNKGCKTWKEGIYEYLWAHTVSKKVKVTVFSVTNCPLKCEVWNRWRWSLSYMKSEVLYHFKDHPVDTSVRTCKTIQCKIYICNHIIAEVGIPILRSKTN